MNYKVVNITRKSLEKIQELLDKNPEWKVVSSGSTEYSETHISKGLRGSVIYSDPPKRYDFIIFEAFNSDAKFDDD